MSQGLRTQPGLQGQEGAGGAEGPGDGGPAGQLVRSPCRGAGGGPDQGRHFTSLDFTQVLRDRGVRISMDGKGRYQDSIFVERLWRTVKYEEVYLKAYASVLEAQRGLEDYFRFYNGLRPHQALGYRTPAEVFHGEQDGVDWESNGWRCSPGEGTQPLAGAPGFSLNPALILSTHRVPPQSEALYGRKCMDIIDSWRCLQWPPGHSR